MINYFLKTIYRLGGATFVVLRNCSPDTKTRYSNLGYSLLLSTALAFVGGFDIAHQFTPVAYYCAAVAFMWSVAVFSFDYFLINGGIVSGFFKYIRVPVGLANVFITTTALFVLLNQSTIDSNIRLANAAKITACDSAYLKDKEGRYSNVTERKNDILKYHKDRCEPEARNGHPGKEYYKKHALCITTDSLIAIDVVKLDSTEKTYNSAYLTEKEALQGITSNNFFAKAKLLPDVLNDNVLVLILAICLFIFLSYIELQAILMKFAIDPNDEYHINLRKYNADRKGLLASQMENEVATEKGKIFLGKKIADEEMIQQNFNADMTATDAMALREMEIKGRIKILRRKGYDATADNLEKLWQEYLGKLNETSRTVADIFNLTQSMMQQVEEIKAASAPDKLAENIFTWIENNISYDSEHSKEHYRTARETYNEKRGVCGELAVLYMSFLKAVNIECSFCEVTIDNSGADVQHACIMIKNNEGQQHLSDVAYKAFTIDHKQYRELSDDELRSKYDNWNQ